MVPFAWQRECYIGGHYWLSAVCQPFLLVKTDFQYNCRRFELILRILWPYMITPGILGGLKDLKDNIDEGITLDGMNDIFLGCYKLMSEINIEI